MVGIYNINNNKKKRSEKNEEFYIYLSIDMILYNEIEAKFRS